MKITVDTNILVRAITVDDAVQAKTAQAVLAEAELVAIPIAVLCELVWVLERSYKIPGAEIAVMLRQLLAGANVAVDRSTAEAGLRLLEAGGDFADGVIARNGQWLGADTFLTFDKEAARLLFMAGEETRLLEHFHFRLKHIQSS